MDKNRFGYVALKLCSQGTFTQEELNSRGAGIFRDLLFGPRSDSLFRRAFALGEPKTKISLPEDDLAGIFVQSGIANSSEDARLALSQITDAGIYVNYDGIGRTYAELGIQKVYQDGKIKFQISAGSYDPLGRAM